MSKTRTPAIRESEGCCIVCLGRGTWHQHLRGETPSLARMLCLACHKQGYSVEQETETIKGHTEPIPMPWTWKLTTPDGQVLDVSTAKPKRISAGRMKKLRAKDTVQDPELSELFVSIKRAGDRRARHG